MSFETKGQKAAQRLGGAAIVAATWALLILAAAWTIHLLGPKQPPCVCQCEGETGR